MARTAKDTVTIPVNGEDKEFSPVYGFDLETVGKDKLAYLVQLGLKQRTAIAVRKIVGEMIPAVELNQTRKADMIACGFEENDPRMAKMFDGKLMEVPSDVPLKLEDIFPAKLDANAVEPATASTNGTSNVEPEPVSVPEVAPTNSEKTNGKKGGKK